MDWVLHKTMDNSAGGIMWEWEDLLCDLDFVDDIALIANSWSSMQQTTTALTVEASKVGLCTNPEKCKVLITTACNDKTDIQAAGWDIEKVDDFCYLGRYISHNGSCEKDVRVRIGTATAVFGKMRKIWKNKCISLKVKMRLYETIILSGCQPFCTVQMHGL